MNGWITHVNSPLNGQKLTSHVLECGWCMHEKRRRAREVSYIWWNAEWRRTNQKLKKLWTVGYVGRLVILFPPEERDKDNKQTQKHTHKHKNSWYENKSLCLKHHCHSSIQPSFDIHPSSIQTSIFIHPTIHWHPSIIHSNIHFHPSNHPWSSIHPSLYPSIFNTSFFCF